MTNSSRQAHWENVYTSKGEQEVSWFQDSPQPSLDLIAATGATSASAIIDIGGGASRLVDALVAQGFEHVTVLDLSAAALAAARSRLGDRGDRVQWITADVTDWKPETQYDVWHDRAAFHFLTSPEDRQAYRQRLEAGLKHGGHLIIGTFAPDGPEKCSGLPVARHSQQTIAAVLGADFQPVAAMTHEHRTPWDSVQKFQFSTFVRR